jgi:uncharacterized membrane protein
MTIEEGRKENIKKGYYKNDLKKEKLNYFQIFLGILAGVILGMLLMHFIYVYSFERLLNASQGIIQNLNIDFNETELANKFITAFNSTILK